TTSSWCAASWALPATASATGSPPRSDAACCTDAASRPVMTTRSPRSTKARAMARPMPRLAPVTIAPRGCADMIDSLTSLRTGNIHPRAMYARLEARRKAEAAMARYGLTIPLERPLHTQRELISSLPDLGYTDVWSAEAGGTDAFTPLALASAWAPRLRL